MNIFYIINNLFVHKTFDCMYCMYIFIYFRSYSVAFEATVYCLVHWLSMLFILDVFKGQHNRD